MINIHFGILNLKISLVINLNSEELEELGMNFQDKYNEALKIYNFTIRKLLTKLKGIGYSNELLEICEKFLKFDRQERISF